MELQLFLSKHLGGFGRYQVYIIILSLALCMPICIHTMAYVIYASTPKFWCVHPRRNDVVNLTASEWRDLFVPRSSDGHYDQCKMYTWATDPNINSTFINATLEAISRGEVFGKDTKQPCERWEYDTETSVRSSLVMEWDMVCGRTWMKSTLASMYALGWILGTQVSGYMADRFGRRKTSQAFSVMTVILGSVLPFCKLYPVFVAVRVLIGFFANGAVGLYFTIAMEVLVAKDRSWASNFFWILWAVEYMALAGVGYLLRDWFPFMLACFVPTVVVLIASYLLPETVAWQVAKGKQEEAKSTLLKIALINNKSLPKDCDVSVNVDEEKTKTRILDLVRTPNIRRFTVVMVVAMFFNGLVYYSIAWNTPDLHGNLYLNVFLAGLLEVIAYLVNIPWIRAVGRRFGFAVPLSLCGVFYMTSVAPIGDLAQNVMIMFAKFFITMSFGIGYVYLSELYPTVIRTTGLSLSLMSARVGVFVAPYVPLLGQNVSEIFCGVMCIIVSMSIFLLPETLNQPLKTSVEEVEKMSNFDYRRMFVVPRKAIVYSPSPYEEKPLANHA